MAKSNYSNIGGSFLPPYVKLAIGISVIGVIGFVTYKIYKKVVGIGGDKDAKAVVNENVNEFDKLQTQGQKLSKPLPAYQQLINDIVIKLNGCEDVRSEAQVIEGIISVVKKPVDWYYLVSKFGKKDIADCGTFGLGKTTYDLPTLLKDQLDTGGFLSINKDGFKRSGFYSNSIDLLKEYFKTIGVVL